MATDAKILLVDDDKELCELLHQLLADENFEITLAYDGKSGLDLVQSAQFDLIVLDVMMPGLNGFEVLREVRKFSAIPVIMLTARGQEVDRIVGLEIGADDYMPKPCSPRELIARIRAVLRRSVSKSDKKDSGSELACDDIRIDRGAHQAYLAGEVLGLTNSEYKILCALLLAVGTVIAKEALTQEALERTYMPYDRSIDMHVSNLRHKLGPAGERIKTVRGVGYLYQPLRKSIEVMS